MAANTPSNTIDNEPDKRPNTTPNSETTTVTPIESRRILCSAPACSMPRIIRHPDRSAKRGAEGPPLHREDQAGRRAVREQLAGAVVELDRKSTRLNSS